MKQHRPHPSMDGRAARYVLAWTAASMVLSPAVANTQISFVLDGTYVTSAAVYDGNGKLLRTLSRGVTLGAGPQSLSWDNLDDAGNPAPTNGTYQFKLLKHQINYVWEGVVGNTSSNFYGTYVHRSFDPIQSVAIAGSYAFYAVGYNEAQAGTHGFRLAAPGYHVQPMNKPDPFTAFSMVATDGTNLYWANTGSGFGPGTTFVVASPFSSTPAANWSTFSAGHSVCLNYRPASTQCYDPQYYGSVIDESARAATPTGIAVQTNGQILAVAHATQGVVKLFDKSSGALLNTFPIPVSAALINQLAMAPSGDLWVIVGLTVQRFTNLLGTPYLAATITGLSNPLAVAVDPTNDNRVLVADGGSSQQVKAFDSYGRQLWTYGTPGGYGSDPAVSTDKLWFRWTASRELSALAIQPDGSFWVADTSNHRLLHIGASLAYVNQLAYIPASYSATVDPNDPQRVFSNFLEYRVNTAQPLQPGDAGSWTLVRNWLASLPLQGGDLGNRGFDGFNTVTTLPNGRTYALSGINNDQHLFELPAAGAARDTSITMLSSCPGAWSSCVLYENGDLGYSTDPSQPTQSAWRMTLASFDGQGNPLWSPPQLLATVSTTAPNTPYYHGAWSGLGGPRYPVTASNRVIFFDQAIRGNEGFHLGAVQLGSTGWSWQASPTGALDGRGSFQTAAIDGTVNYGGNMVWARGVHVLYGYHGEGYTDQSTHQVGQANQFMHFHENGLFVGQFGVPNLNTGQPGVPQIGQAGNSFSNILVSAGADALYWYHNDESVHGGVHRWRIENLRSMAVLTGSGPLDSSIILLP